MTVYISKFQQCSRFPPRSMIQHESVLTSSLNVLRRVSAINNEKVKDHEKKAIVEFKKENEDQSHFSQASQRKFEVQGKIVSRVASDGKSVKTRDLAKNGTHNATAATHTHTNTRAIHHRFPAGR